VGAKLVVRGETACDDRGYRCILSAQTCVGEILVRLYPANVNVYISYSSISIKNRYEISSNSHSMSYMSG